MSDFVECKICNKKFKAIQHLHLSKHNISFEEYIQKFPDAKVCSDTTANKRSVSNIGREVSQKTRDKISKSNQKSWIENPNQGRSGHPLSTESKEALSNKLKGHEVSEETRKKISITGLGREPWNKGLTKDDDARLVTVSEKISQWNKEFFTPEKRKEIGQTLKQRYSDGLPVPNSKNGFREDLQMSFRSRWEANFARVQNYLNVPWEYEKHSFTIHAEDGSILMVYLPDFYINGMYIEIKGHAHSEDNWKCDCQRCVRDKLKLYLFKKEYPNISFKLFGKNDYLYLSKTYKKIIPTWEHSK